MREPSGGEFAVEAAMVAEISGERGKGEYALTKALLTQQIHRGGGGGHGAGMGEMEMMAVWWRAREVMVEVMLYSAARVHCCERRRRRQRIENVSAGMERRVRDAILCALA